MMKKILVILALLGLLAGCTGPTKPQETNPPETLPPEKPTQTAPPETTPSETEKEPPVSVIGDTDSYWVATSWTGEDGSHSLEGDSRTLDLLIRQDGTARFRDIRDNLFLADDADQFLVWEQGEDGTASFRNSIYLDPVLRCTRSGDTLQVEYRGILLSMEQTSLPQEPGTLYSPAQMVGTWLMITGEMEGYEWEAMPGTLETLVIRPSVTDPSTLVAGGEEREFYGSLWNETSGQTLEILREPLYEGCGNELWSVRIGPVSPKNEYGYPTDSERYATLLDQDTMLVQNYFTIDGAPAVSYQKFRRLSQLLSRWDLTAQELTDTSWSCIGYRDADGKDYPAPPELQDLYVQLLSGGVCRMGKMDKGSEAFREFTGSWCLSKGGAILLYSEDPELWYGGTVSGYLIETEVDMLSGYDMYLYYGGGILHLLFSGYG